MSIKLDGASNWPGPPMSYYDPPDDGDDDDVDPDIARLDGLTLDQAGDLHADLVGRYMDYDRATEELLHAAMIGADTTAAAECFRAVTLRTRKEYEAANARRAQAEAKERERYIDAFIRDLNRAARPL